MSIPENGGRIDAELVLVALYSADGADHEPASVIHFHPKLKRTTNFFPLCLQRDHTSM